MLSYQDDLITWNQLTGEARSALNSADFGCGGNGDSRKLEQLQTKA
ncbi:hypothetical protein F441_10918 [Phytophthora nicotianae CJ01A1]|uniref:Uncharacterized protein n=4 Tax=Phytophthora nicotianae TaxID=4792 RepID=W2Q476_PHYN3|nr:hypothetical protein PPTG_23150 [Phytophthora nicotianae INRA-310]ETM44194.1 hypothetical protein L914_10550 [Phytophthora nicotianae]ETN07676.1 hypothetical protein PPTG_23150 [Phytophthora nicotianae INRA-310]ETO72952.1 hypothetical protein F444_11066 [Phytophthora nicotianae P1976]ETP14115.1 hypothetical protein F441_10918 [Phytophthora nicotianae CJ01A1]